MIITLYFLGSLERFAAEEALLPLCSRRTTIAAGVWTRGHAPTAGVKIGREAAAIVPPPNDDRDEAQCSLGQRTGQMIIFNPNPHRLRITPSATEPGRFDWSITRDDVIVQRSARSFGSEGASAANGDAALREVTARWKGVG